MIFLLAKLPKPASKPTNRGFTLIELLVAMIIATIIITPLLGFMVNTLNRDRLEQTKATSEAEIQAALDYIAQDLEQAVYIYNANGLTNTSTSTPIGIKDQIPPVAAAPGCGSTTPTCTPVLVFWKRETQRNALPIPPTPPSTVPKACVNPGDCDDTFVYSLVAYYIIKGDNGGGTWSDVARISRFQIRDGVIDPNDPGTATVPKYVTAYPPSQGFRGFNLKLPGSTLSDKMNLWTKVPGVNYADSVVTLIDFVDKGTTAPTPPAPTQNCPANTQRVPPLPAAATNPETGFYACIDSTNTYAQVFLRGNALARINDPSSYSSKNAVYFPTASVQVKGRGFLGVN